jgi:hypothetical protein
VLLQGGARSGHREPFEVLGDGAQCSEEADAEFEVEAAQSEPDAGDVEGRAVDEDRHVTSDPLAREALAGGDCDA